VVIDGIDGEMYQAPGGDLAWSGLFHFPKSLAGRIRAGNTYRLDVDGGISITIVTGTLRASPRQSEYSCSFETTEQPLS
jgi:hypothetical protein